MRIIPLRTSQLNCCRRQHNLAVLVSTEYISYYILRSFEHSDSWVADSDSKEPE